MLTTNGIKYCIGDTKTAKNSKKKKSQKYCTCKKNRQKL
jgi:hypothetical protein